MVKIKFAFALLALLWYSTYCIAQPNGKFEELGKVTTDELKMKECSFEKDADAMRLLDLGQAYFEVKNEIVFTQAGRLLLTTAYYQRIKIFNERGYKYADIHLRIRSGKQEEINYNIATINEDITDIKGTTYNLTWDGQEIQKIELDPSDIHRTKLNDFETEINFTLPGVKSGSVFEITYTRSRYVLTSLPTWNFCSDIPCARSSFSIGFLDAASYYSQQFTHHIEYKKFSQPFTSSIKVPLSAQRMWGMINKNFLTGTTVTYAAHNIASVKDEPYINTTSNYTDRVAFQLKSINPPFAPYDGIINTWNRFADDLWSKPGFGQRLSDNGIPPSELKDIIAEPMTGEEKAKAIFEFIRTTMSWDGTDTILAKNDNAKTWKNKTGNTAEINFLLINTLRSAGLTVYPCLSGSRATGFINMEYPMIDQFKQVEALVEFSDGRKIILDASDKFTPFGLTRYKLLNNYCFVIHGPGSSNWYDTFNQGDNSENAIINARLDSTGNIQGEIVAIFDNYSRAMFRQLKATGQDTTLDKEMSKRIGKVTIESSKDTIDQSRNRYVRKVNFTSHIADDNDSLLRLSLAAIYGQTDNPFVSNHRTSDVDFGYNQKFSSLLTIELPAGYELDSSPKPYALVTPDSSIYYRFASEQRDNILYIQQRLEYRKSFYPFTEYPTFFEFHKAYYKLMQEPVVLRKKPRGQ